MKLLSLFLFPGARHSRAGRYIGNAVGADELSQ